MKNGFSTHLHQEGLGDSNLCPSLKSCPAFLFLNFVLHYLTFIYICNEFRLLAAQDIIKDDNRGG